MESGESVVLSIQQRMDILKDWETSSIANVAKKYKVDHATIWRIQQNATTIAGFINKGKLEEHRNNLKEPIYEELEKHLLVWCMERRAMGDVISDEQLLEKAAELKKGFGDCPNLKISKGWLGRFKRRHKGPLARIYDGKPTAEDQDKDRDVIKKENRNEQIDESMNERSEEETAVDVGEDYGIKMSQEERQELEAAFMRLERYRDRIPLSARYHLNGVKLTMLGNAKSKSCVETKE